MSDYLNIVEEVIKAQKVIAGVARITPLSYAETFSRLIGSDIYFKFENLQKTGSFKIRGAMNKISTLSIEEKRHGVIAASAGNHAQGVAHAATMTGVKSTIVMPEGAPVSKAEATKNYGATVIMAGENYDQAFQHAQKLQDETQATFVNAFDDYAIIAGQGTVGLEILEQCPEVEAVIVPIGGGGLISGVAGYLKERRPGIKIIGVQTENVPSMYLSRQSGKIISLEKGKSIADGINVRKPGTLTFPLVEKYVDDIVTVDDEAIVRAMLMLLERSKTVVEGSGAVSLAALLAGKVSLQSKKTVLVLSGGNIDFNVISQIIERGLVKTGRLTNIRTILEDRPSALQGLLQVIASTGANVISVSHERLKPTIPLLQTEVTVTLETRNKEHVQEIMDLLDCHSYTAEYF